MLISVGDLHEQVADHIRLGLLCKRTLGILWVTQAGQITTAIIISNGIYKRLTLLKLKKFIPLVSSLMFLIISKSWVFRFNVMSHIVKNEIIYFINAGDIRQKRW